MYTAAAQTWRDEMSVLESTEIATPEELRSLCGRDRDADEIAIPNERVERTLVGIVWRQRVFGLTKAVN